MHNDLVFIEYHWRSRVTLFNRKQKYNIQLQLCLIKVKKIMKVFCVIFLVQYVKSSYQKNKCSGKNFSWRNSSLNTQTLTRLNRRDGVVIRASVGFISQIESYQKTFKKCYLQLSRLALSKKGTMWRTSEQDCLWCPWARHLTGCLYLYVAYRCGAKQSIRSGGPTLTEDSQIERKR